MLACERTGQQTSVIFCFCHLISGAVCGDSPPLNGTGNCVHSFKSTYEDGRSMDFLSITFSVCVLCIIFILSLRYLSILRWFSGQAYVLSKASTCVCYSSPAMITVLLIVVLLKQSHMGFGLIIGNYVLSSCLASTYKINRVGTYCKSLQSE